MEEKRGIDRQVEPATTPQVIQVKNEGASHTPLWILISVIVGFLLPVCSCAVLLFSFVTSLSVTSLGTSGAASGVGDAVAIVRVEGVITSSDHTEFAQGATSGVVISDLQTAAADPTVKAIILRIDSPGGSVTGSAQIYEAVRELEKPVVVSMASVAASGGYYVSAPADYIYARPDTVTGSIGVILTLYNAEELLDEIGVDVITITSGPNKDMGSTWEAPTPEQEEILRNFVEESYNDFVRVVADGRGLSEATVRELADGRIYSGRQALDVDLVDGLGDLQDAIDKAADLGGISGEPRLVEYEHLPSFGQLIGGLSSRLNQTEAERVLEIMEAFTFPSIEYRYVGPASK